MCKDYTDNDNSNKTVRSVYTKYMIEIMKAESKTYCECVYLLVGGMLTTNTVQTKKCSVSSTDLDNLKKLMMKNLKKIYHKMSIHGVIYYVVIKVDLVIWIIWLCISL